jgi:hypothetical protein
MYGLEVSPHVLGPRKTRHKTRYKPTEMASTPGRNQPKQLQFPGTVRVALAPPLPTHQVL